MKKRFNRLITKCEAEFETKSSGLQLSVNVTEFKKKNADLD